ncbi:hypothetical protein B9Z55_015697 [Caenorhabditis nigoni]|nr:hypothetical protein B9Z55_015697 [Caenorhabditis nigoni]
MIVKEWVVNNRKEGFQAIGFVANKNIRKGAELTIDYGYDYNLIDGDEPAPKKAKLESPQELPQERRPPTLTSPFTPDENRVGTGSTIATDRQSSTNLAVVPWPIPPPALIEDRVSAPRDGIHESQFETTKYL